MTGCTRRVFLRGAAGAAIALPALASLGGRVARGAPTPPKRFVYFYHPNGVDTATFWPTAGTSETQWTLGASQQAALAQWQSRLLWIGGLNMGVAITGPGEQHQRGLGAALTGGKIDTGSFVGNDGTTAGWALGQSLDQRLVALIGQGTPVPSLQLGVNARQRDVSGVVSYGGARLPLLPENDPRQTYNTLFYGQSPARGVSDLAALRRSSVLDGALAQLNAFKQRVSHADSQRLDQHLAYVRDLEQRLAALPVAPGSSALPVSTPSAPAGVSAATGVSGMSGASASTVGRTYDGCGPLGAPTVGNPLIVDDMPALAELQLELLALALRCDLTRVVTVMFSDAQDHIPLPFLGVNSDIHSLTHMQDGAPPRAGLVARDTWQAQQFAYLLDKLESAAEVDGSRVLDNTLCMWGSEVSVGNTHSHLNMPFIFSGGALGWRLARYIQYTGRNHNDLLLSIAQGFSGTESVFGDAAFSFGPLGNLT